MANSITELKAAKLATGMAGVMLGDACSEIDQLRADLYRCHRALEQAQDCILGATPEDCTPTPSSIACPSTTVH